MANVISSFLVGIGFDYDRKSADAIGTGIDSIKSKALQLGSVVAGAFGIKALTFDFAQSKDMLGKFSEVFGVTANDVQALGHALETEGGTLESFMSQLESIERARARIRVGDVAFFAPAGKAGINPNDIANARNATEAYLGLADSFAAMNQQQRINAAEALGLDEASIRLLSQGRGAVDDLIAKYQKIQPITNEMTEAAAEFNRQWLEIKANIGGAADELSIKFLPVVNRISQSINKWFEDMRVPGIDSLSEQDPSEASSRTGLPSWVFMPLPDLFDKATDRNTYDEWFMKRGENKPQIKIESDKSYWPDQAPDNGIGDELTMGMGRNRSAPEISTDSEPSLLIDSSGPEKNDLIPTQKNNIEKGSTRDGLDNWYKSREPAPTNQTIDITLNLDGSVLDRRTVKVVNGIAQTAIDDLTSSTVA